MSIFARASFAIDPAWPGVSPGRAWMLIALAAAAIVGLTLWTYLGVRRTSPRRLAAAIALRMIALLAALLMMLRPSLAWDVVDAVDPSRLLVLIDVSRSMSATDEFNGASRLKRARDLVFGATSQAALRRLADERKVEIAIYQGAAETKRHDPETPADGKATDIGRWFDDLRRDAAGDIPVQAMLILTDGVDTGDPARTLAKAAEFRGKWPLALFGLGQPTTTGQDKDIALDQIFVLSQPILAKGKIKVKAIVQAPGFEQSRVDFSLWLEDLAKKTTVKAASRTERLQAAIDNVVELEADAPDVDGEIKIVVKATPLPGETSTLNNEIATFAHVSKEGVRILWVEGRKRAFEPVFALRHALAKDRRFQVVYVERTSPTPDGDPYRFDQTAYDVLVIGDVSAAKFGDNDVLRKVRERVQNQGMGLVMLGGQETFGNGGWPASPIADLFPVKLDRPGQIDGKVRVAPTAEGMQYLLRFADDEKANRRLWDKALAPLEGMTQPGTRDPRATLFATVDGSETPVLAGIVRGKGRVLAFPGDTTWQAWRRTPEAAAAYERFWRQMMLWLAQQENSQGTVFVELDQRRVERPRSVGFRVGFRGVEAANPKFSAKIVGPRGEEYPIPIGGDPRGVWTPPAAGEYAFHVEGKGTTPLGKPIDGRDVARFVVIETDRELLRPAADHEFLEKLAAAADGSFARADDKAILKALDEIQSRQAPPHAKVVHWPDWKRAPASESAADQFGTLFRSTAMFGLAVYIACLCTEWYLRRRWGMV